MDAPAPQPGRPRYDLGELVREHRAALEGQVSLSSAQRRVLSALASCRTAALGGHMDECPACGYSHPAYNSCRNRHCPKCQALAQERWIAARSERLLPVRHYHAVFTLPAELRPLAQQAPRLVFAALFQAASATLLELGASRWHALPGLTLVLHTWTRDLRFHPHVHALVTAGGLQGERQRWHRARYQYLFPVRVMGELLRGKVLDALRQRHRRGRFPAQSDQAFEDLLARLAQPSWVVYVKPAFRRAEQVLAYLGRYTHRVALANSRIVRVTPDAVTLHTKGGQTATLTPVELLRRFVQHVLPGGFQKLRHYGLYAGARVHGPLAQARALLIPASHGSATAVAPVALSWSELLRNLTGRDVHRCPRCGGPLLRLPLPLPATGTNSRRHPPAVPLGP